MRLQHEIPQHVELPELSPVEIAEAGRQAQEFIDSEAFTVFKTAIRSKQGLVTARLMQMGATNEAAKYADLVGELKGVAAVKPILRGIVESGKEAEAELRKVEEEGSS